MSDQVQWRRAQWSNIYSVQDSDACSTGSRTTPPPYREHTRCARSPSTPFISPSLSAAAFSRLRSSCGRERVESSNRARHPPAICHRTSSDFFSSSSPWRDLTPFQPTCSAASSSLDASMRFSRSALIPYAVPYRDSFFTYHYTQIVKSDENVVISGKPCSHSPTSEALSLCSTDWERQDRVVRAFDDPFVHIAQSLNFD